MKSILQRLCFSFSICALHFVSPFAQNLVPNPGFEIITKCPQWVNTREEMLTPPWKNPHNFDPISGRGTPDLYHACSNPSDVGVPWNKYGYQYGHTGNGYAGIINWSGGFLHEYLQTPLNEPLVAGQIYHLGFYISLADKWCPSNRIGVHFSIGEIPGGFETFNYEPQIEYTEFISEDIYWTLIEWCYVATGGEDHITIGNFRRGNESDLLESCEGPHGAYYYIDDVFIYNMSVLDIGNDASLCPGDSIILDAGSGDTQYLWQDLSNTDTFLVNTPGKYYVQATNLCGTASDTVIISLDTAKPQIELAQSMTLCEEETIILDPQLTNVQFAWSDGSALPQLVIDDPGQYALTVTNGCGSDTATINVIDGGSEPSVSLGSFIPICPGETLEVEPIQANATSWLWHDGSQSASFVVSNPGIIYVSVFNDCGSASDTAEVILSSFPPALDLGPDILLCSGEDISIHANVTGVEYLWQDGSTESTFTTSEAGTYILQITNACGSDIDSVTVSLMDLPPFPDLGNDTTMCNGNVLVLEWNGPEDVTILWENGLDLPFNFIDQSGLYYLTASNICGSTYDEVEVVFIDAPEPFSLGNDTILCSGESILLSVPFIQGIITWQDGSHEISYLADSTQLYQAKLENECGMQHDQIQITIDDHVPTPLSELTRTLCAEDIITLNVTQPFEADYLWNTGSDSPVIDVNTLGNYEVIISTNCIHQEFEFEIIPGTGCVEFQNIFIPNVFSPNGDGINDLLVIHGGRGVEEIIQFEIFDRWGNVVFLSTHYQPGSDLNSWDGSMKGQTVSPGVFGYKLIVAYRDGRSETLYGDMTIVR